MTLNLNISKTIRKALFPFFKLQLTLLLLLALAASAEAENSCVYQGKINFVEHEGVLSFYFEDMPYLNCSDLINVDSVKVRWFQQCNQWSDDYYEVGVTGIYDTLTIVAEGWRAVWAETTWYSDEVENMGSISDITQAVYYISPEAPFLEQNILQNPSNGYFEIECKTNATKHYILIAGPYGLVYSKWHYGNGIVPIQLLPINPSGIYTVFTRWHFTDECTQQVQTRQQVLVIK